MTPRELAFDAAQAAVHEGQKRPLLTKTGNRSWLASAIIAHCGLSDLYRNRRASLPHEKGGALPGYSAQKAVLSEEVV